MGSPSVLKLTHLPPQCGKTCRRLSSFDEKARTTMARKHRIPGYLTHSSGQARVILDGTVHYLGPYGSRESKQRYDALIGDW